MAATSAVQHTGKVKMMMWAHQKSDVRFPHHASSGHAWHHHGMYTPDSRSKQLVWGDGLGVMRDAYHSGRC